MKTEQLRQKLMAALNAWIILSTAVIVTHGILAGAGKGQVGGGMYGWGYLKAFTNLSNILAALACGVVLSCNLRNIKNGTAELPRAVLVLHYAATSAVGLTFVIVAGFLGPMFQLNGAGYFTMFSGDMFFFHFLNPVLCGVELVLLEREHILKVRDNFIAVIPTVLYSFLYAYMVVIAQKWSDFYNFTLGGHFEYTPAAMLIMYLISFAVAFAQRKLHNKKVSANQHRLFG